MSKVKDINLIIKNSALDEFKNKLSELSKVDEFIKIKIDEDKVFMYSTIGTSNLTLLFKSFEMNVSDLFEFDEDFQYESVIELIISSSKKFVKSLALMESNVKISGKIKQNNNNTYSFRNCSFKSGKIKIGVLIGESKEIRDMNRDRIHMILNTNPKTNFDVNIDTFNVIKNLSNIYKSSEEERKLITIEVKNGKADIFEDMLWNYEVANIDDNSVDISIMFNKAYLNLIKFNEITKFNIYDSFILINENNSFMMISFEQTF